MSGDGQDEDLDRVRARYDLEREQRLVPGRSDIVDVLHDERFTRYLADPFTPMAEREPVEDDPDLKQRLRAAASADRVRRDIAEIESRVLHRNASLAR